MGWVTVDSSKVSSESVCRHCRVLISKVNNEWLHPYGNAYCMDAQGFTATPIRRAEPSLETEVL